MKRDRRETHNPSPIGQSALAYQSALLSLYGDADERGSRDWAAGGFS